MTVKVINTAIVQHDQVIKEYQDKLASMSPAFLYDYAVTDKLNNILEDTIACRDMLSDMLKDGDI